MSGFTKLNNPSYIDGGSIINGTSNEEILGGSVDGDAIVADSGNDLIIGDTLTANPDLPLEYTVDLSGLPFANSSVEYSINNASQSGTLGVSSTGDATVMLDQSQVTGSDIEVDVTGIIGEVDYEFYDAVPAGFSARNIPTTGADFTGTAEDFNVRALAVQLTGNHETYAVRYTTQIHIETAGEYTFSTRSDDGSIFSINGQEVVVNDGLHGTRTRTETIQLTAGTHDVEVAFFENYGGDNLSVTIAGPDTQNNSVSLLDSGLAGRKETITQTINPADVNITGLLPGFEYEFFDSVPSGFTVENIPETGADFSGVVEELNVRALALELTGSHNTYSIRYTGQIYIDQEGQYDFSSLSDDGFSLHIGGQNIITYDGLHAPSPSNGSANLEAGYHDVEIRFFENTGQDVLNITFSGPDTNGEAINLFDSDNVGHRGNIVATDGGDDVIDAGEGDDTISAGQGDDIIIGGEGADSIDGGVGTDTVSFEESISAVRVNLYSGEGRDGSAEGDTYQNVENVHGSTHDDEIVGSGIRNRLSGHNGDDNISGGEGNDVLIGGDGADVLDGGAGARDAVEYNWSTAGITVNLETGTGSNNHADGDQISNTEYVYGSFYDDDITGDGGVNRLVGRHGNDILNGGGGNDVLVGGFGSDILNGGSGTRDAADYTYATSGVGLDLTLGGFAGEADGDTFSGIEYVYGSSHDDTITGDAGRNRLVGADGNDILSGGDGDDYIIGGAGADVIDGGSGSRDTVEFKEAETGVGVDLANGGFAGEADGDTYTGIEYVYGSNHDDIIIGDNEQNRLIGFDGNDQISGGGGNDYILGKAGNDILTGDAGDDVFLYKTNFGDDVITDFEAGAGRTDRIWLDLVGIEDFSDITMTDTAQGAVIDTNGFGTILLQNVSVVDLNNDDFIF